MRKSYPASLLLFFLFSNSSGLSLPFVEQQKPAPSQAFTVGNGVLPPKAVYTPDPSYTDAARKAKVSGKTVLSLIVNQDGTTRSLRIERSLRPDLDQQAIAAVSAWKFEPATKDGKPVPVKITVEVSFRVN